MTTQMKFDLAEALDAWGNDVPAWGFTFDDQFIVNATVSPCGRFEVYPAYYGLSNEDASRLAALNQNRGLLAYEGGA